MSDFKELRERLLKQQEADQERQTSEANRIAEQRVIHQPMLDAAFSVFGDYYANIILPDLPGAKIIPRQKDGPTEEDIRLKHPYFAYVMNIIAPQQVQEYSWHDSHRLQEPIKRDEVHGWHPNVALHFGTSIGPYWDYDKKRTSDDLRLSFYLKVWGAIPNPDNLSLPEGINSHFDDMGWFKMGTGLTFVSDGTPRTTDLLKHCLTVVTPNVLNHNGIWQGTYPPRKR